MQVYKRLRFLLLGLILTSTALAKSWTAETLPIPYLQDARQYVSNPDRLLSPSVVDSINVLLFQLEKEKGVQSLVVIVGQVEGADCYSFGMTLGEKYGIGSKKQDTGLIIILSTQDHCYYILTGQGLEGSLPDAICRRIERQYMVPFLKKGDWDQALLQTVGAVTGYLHGDDTLKAEPRSNPARDQWVALLFVAFLLLFFFLGLRSKKRRLRCPRCKKAQLQPQNTIRQPRMLHRRFVTYVCPRCGYTEVREEDNDDDLTHGGGGRFFPPIFPFGGSRRGGGSFGGGSFGGGSFGGGGSGGRF